MNQPQEGQGFAYSAGTGRPGFELPALACDCHMHFFDDAYPFVEGAVLRPPNASIEDYRRLQRRLGLTRNVVVQPSPYGTDNRLLIKSLDELGESARGVAVIDDRTGEDEVRELDRHRVRGVRFNLVQQGATHIDMLETVARRIAPHGWHVQLHMLPAQFVAQQRKIASLPVPVVIDHMARVASDPAQQSAVLDTLRVLLSGGNTWLKLSGAYLASAQPHPHGDLSDLVKRLVAEFPERLVWGSDWPHVTEAIKPDDAKLLDAFSGWIEAPDLREQILVRNPAALYRF